MKRLFILAIICFISISSFSDSESFSAVAGGGKEYAPKRQNVTIDKETIRKTPSNGMIPFFTEPAITDKDLADKVLRAIGESPLPDFHPGHSHVMPPLKDKVQKLLQDRVDNYGKLLVFENEIKESFSRSSVSGIIRHELTDRQKSEYRNYRNNLRKIDRDLETSLEEEPERTVNSVTDYVIRRGRKATLPALNKVVRNVSNHLERDDGQGRSSRVSGSSGNTELKSFFKILGTMIVGVSAMAEEDSVAKKFLIMFYMMDAFMKEFELSGSASASAPSPGTTPAPTPDSDDSSGTSVYDSEVGSGFVTDPSDDTATPEPPSDQGTTQPATGATGTLSEEIDFSRLIENAEFTDHVTMTASDIQQFLNSKNSCLKNAYRGQYPSQIIYDVCNEIKINPKVMLATAQKEQSLVTRRTATQHKLDWAMGVGCPDNGYHNPRYQGLDKQLAYAGRIFRRWYDDGLSKNVSQEGFRKRVNYGTAWITCRNEATYSLYMYTPHTVDIRLNVRGGGNYLFCQIYIDFFGGFLK